MSEYMRNKLIKHHSNIAEDELYKTIERGYYYFYDYVVFVDSDGDIQYVTTQDIAGF